MPDRPAGGDDYVSKMEEWVSKWKSVSKDLTVEYTIVPKSVALPKAAIKDFKLQKVTTEYSGDPNGKRLADAVATAAPGMNGSAEIDAGFETAIDRVINVYSTYNGKTFELPQSIFSIEEAEGTNVTIGTQTFENGDSFTAIDAVSGGAIKWRDLYLNDGTTYARQNATVTLDVSVTTDSVSGSAMVSKDVVVSDAASYLANVEVKDIATAPTGTNIETVFSSVAGTDQYGLPYGTFTYKATVTYDESKDRLTHLPGSFAVENNGTNSTDEGKKLGITGAEVGDTFKLSVVATDTVNGKKITVDTDKTVGADTKAWVSNEEDSDKDFRKNVLKMYR